MQPDVPTAERCTVYSILVIRSHFIQHSSTRAERKAYRKVLVQTYGTYLYLYFIQSAQRSMRHRMAQRLRCTYVLYKVYTVPSAR